MHVENGWMAASTFHCHPSGTEDAGLSEDHFDFPTLAHCDLPSPMATFDYLQLNLLSFPTEHIGDKTSNIF